MLESYLIYLHEDRMGILLGGKYKILNHLTFPENINTIRRQGIIPKKKYSKYGNPPMLKAVYLYHASARDVIADFKKTFPNKRIVNIMIAADRLDPNLFHADEDCFRYPHKRQIRSEDQMRKEAPKCLLDRGTTAYKGTVPPNSILSIKPV